VLGNCIRPGRSASSTFGADESAAALVLECSDIDEAQRILAELPLVPAELIDFELSPLRAYPGFARLFATAGS
jgi:hypothetical protein